MKFVRVALSAFGGAFLLASSAMAADFAAPPPALWGFYFGGGVCYDWAKLDGTFYPNGQGNQPEVPAEGTAQSPCLTVEAGISTEVDNFYFDASVSYDFQKKKGDVSVDQSTAGPPIWVPVGEFEVGNILTVAGRAGVKATPDLIVYALLGYSWSKFVGTAPGITISQNISGPTIGGGIESRFDPNWSGRLEGRFTSFGTVTHVGPPDGVAKITDTSIRAVLIYRP